MTRQLELTGKEPDHSEKIAETAKEVLRTDRDPRVSQNIPRKKQVTDNNDLGYFLKDAQNSRLSELFYDAVFNELWTRIMSPPESR
jgi:hypothetical protein